MDYEASASAQASEGKVYKKKRSNFELKPEASSKVLFYNLYRETMFENGQWHYVLQEAPGQLHLP